MTAPVRQTRATSKRASWEVRRGWLRPARRRKTQRARRWPWALAACLLLVTALLAWGPVQRFCYPLRFLEPLRAQSLAVGLPPSLVAAVVLNESQFRPDACSSAGALGLMQLMPTTATWMAEREGYRFDDLLQPEVNLHLGTAYLSHLQTRFGGDPVATLAAYNAGPENVKGWLKGRKRQLTLPISRILFPETRHYVRRVLRSQMRYQQLYPELDR